VKIVLKSINDLIPHEEIEYDRMKNILVSMLKVGYIFKPIIVDKVKNVIIDGHHRFHALKMLGFKQVPVVEADYGEDIKFINSWMHVSNDVNASENPKRFFNELLHSVKHGTSEVYVKFDDDIYRVGVDQIDFYLTMKEFTINKNPLSMLYKLPSNKDVCFSYNTCIIMPKLHEQDVYKVTSENIVLPPRTTYHVTHLKSIKRIIPLHVLKAF